MYVLAYNDSKQLEIPTTELKTNLKEYLEPFRMVTDAITIKKRCSGSLPTISCN